MVIGQITDREQGETELRQAQLVMYRMLKVVDKICEKHKLNYWIDAGTLLGAVRHGGFIPWDDDLDICMPRKDYFRFIEIASQELPEDIHFQQKDSQNSSKWRWIKLRDKYSTLIQLSEQNRDVSYHQGIFIDIFPYDMVRSNFLWSKIFLNRRFKVAPIKWVRRMYPVFNLLALFPVKLIGFEFLKKCFLKYFCAGEPRYVATGLEITAGFQCFNKDIVFPLQRIKFEQGEFNCPNNYHKYLEQMYGDYMQLPAEEDRIFHAVKIIPFSKCNHSDTLDYRPMVG